MATPIHQQLAKVRADAGLRQADIASAIGVQPAAVSLIEAGQRNTTTERVERWASTCGAEVIITTSASTGVDALLRDMPDADVRLVLDLVKLLPRMSAEARATLHSLVGVWRRFSVRGE